MQTDTRETYSQTTDRAKDSTDVIDYSALEQTADNKWSSVGWNNFFSTRYNLQTNRTC